MHIHIHVHRHTHTPATTPMLRSLVCKDWYEPFGDVVIKKVTQIGPWSEGINMFLSIKQEDLLYIERIQIFVS